MPTAAPTNRPLIIGVVIIAVLLVLGLILVVWPDQAQPEATPSLEERRVIDGDPTPPDERAPPQPPIDSQATPAPGTPPR